MSAPLLATLFLAALGCLTCNQIAAMPAVECPQDLRLQLPDQVRKSLDAALGVESMAEVNVKGPRLRLVIAIALPSWHFSEEGCSGNMSSDDAPRTIVVWKEHGKSFSVVAKSSKVLWPRATAGNPMVKVFAEGRRFIVRQASNPIRASLSDDFTFALDPRRGGIRLEKRESSSLYNTLAAANDDELSKYDAATKTYGQVCEDDGYEAAINFLTGQGLVRECKFAQPDATRHIRIPPQVVYLEDIDQTSFEHLPFYSE